MGQGEKDGGRLMGKEGEGRGRLMGKGEKEGGRLVGKGGEGRGD